MIPFNEWARKLGLTTDAARKFLRRNFIEDKKNSCLVKKKRIYAEQWFIDEDVKAEKSKDGRWIIYKK